MGWLWLDSRVKCSPNDGAMHRISSLWSLLFASFGSFNTARFWWHWGWFIGFSILGLLNQQKTRGRGPADPDLRGFSRQTKAAALEKESFEASDVCDQSCGELWHTAYSYLHIHIHIILILIIYIYTYYINMYILRKWVSYIYIYIFKKNIYISTHTHIYIYIYIYIYTCVCAYIIIEA